MRCCVACFGMYDPANGHAACDRCPRCYDALRRRAAGDPTLRAAYGRRNRRARGGWLGLASATVTCACGCGRVGPDAGFGLVNACYVRAARARRARAAARAAARTTHAFEGAPPP